MYGPQILALAIALTAQATDARADVMATCTSEISKYCGDVSRGEGRIVACLLGQKSRLRPACLAKVQELARMSPAFVRMVLDSSFRASLPEACAAPAAQFCPGMTTREGRVFACLYARADRVPKACSDAAQQALKLAE